jgi:hypothetical protein
VKTLALFILAIFSLSAQSRGVRGVPAPAPAARPAPAVRGGFSNGTAVTPGTQPIFGNAVVAPPGIVVPTGINNNALHPFVNGRAPFHGAGRGTGTGPVYVGYPVYIGGYGYGYGGDSSYYGQQPPQQQQQGSVTVIYPPAPAPIIINPYGGGDAQYSMSGMPPMQSQMSLPPSDTANEPAHFLIAFKDHTIYSAVAYWVDGDTLHYFTNGNTHNQVSLSLIDSDLTARLNKDSGVEVKLPAGK